MLSLDLVHIFCHKVKDEELSKLLEIVEPWLREKVCYLVPAHTTCTGLQSKWRHEKYI